jgi:general secretion pathway protein H
MLVVLLIAGLLAGLVSVIARPDERALLRVEAERLARLLDLAVAESGLTGKSIRWTADGPGYRFWRLREDTGWSEIRDGGALRARTLPGGMTISALRVENGRPQGALRLEFSPYVPPPPFVIELSLGAERYGVGASPMGEVRAVPNGGGSDG